MSTNIQTHNLTTINGSSAWYKSYLEKAVVNISDINLATIFTHSKHTRQILSRKRCQQRTTLEIKQFSHHFFTNKYVALIRRYAARHVSFGADKVIERLHDASSTHIYYVLLSTQQIASKKTSPLSWQSATTSDNKQHAKSQTNMYIMTQTCTQWHVHNDMSHHRQTCT